jgi:selenide,water dikinase
LAQVLRRLPEVVDDRVLVDALTHDDAAVYRLSDDRAIVASVDFFTPIVDDAHTFGRIVAANALSDLYAMGARPLFALNIVAWPRAPEMLDLVADAVQGVAEKTSEAGAFVLGGHSIEDPEPKLGMVAVGEAAPDTLLTNAAARPGDRLVLTKALGTGILSTALKRGLLGESDMAPAIRSMTTLNAGALAAVRSIGDQIRGATDVTGFGLLGHLREMLRASNVGATIFARAMPAFDGVVDWIKRGTVPGGTARNRAAAEEYTQWDAGVTDAVRTLLCDAQTSGGLLIAAPAGDADALVEALRTEGTPTAAVIGEVVSENVGGIEVRDVA